MLPVVHRRDRDAHDPCCCRVAQPPAHDQPDHLSLLWREMLEGVLELVRIDLEAVGRITVLNPVTALLVPESITQERTLTVQIVIPATHEILRYTEEITDADRLLFNVSQVQEPEEGLLGQIVGDVGGDRPPEEAVDPRVAGLVELHDDLAAREGGLGARRDDELGGRPSRGGGFRKTRVGTGLGGHLVASLESGPRRPWTRSPVGSCSEWSLECRPPDYGDDHDLPRRPALFRVKAGKSSRSGGHVREKRALRCRKAGHAAAAAGRLRRLEGGVHPICPRDRNGTVSGDFSGRTVRIARMHSGSGATPRRRHVGRRMPPHPRRPLHGRRAPSLPGAGSRGSVDRAGKGPTGGARRGTRRPGTTRGVPNGTPRVAAFKPRNAGQGVVGAAR